MRLAAGNENEQRHLLPLIDALLEREIRPGEVWADRGYDSRALEQALREREIEPRISKRRLPHEPIPAGESTSVVWRGKKRRAKTRDRQARHRWPIERTNAWLSNFGQLRRNTDRRVGHRLAQLALAIVILLTAKLLDWRDRWSPA